MKIAFAPNAFEVSQKDSYISNTLMGTKPDTAKAPLRSLQTNNAIRMTMYYYCAGIDNGLTCQVRARLTNWIINTCVQLEVTTIDRGSTESFEVVCTHTIVFVGL